MVQKKCIKYTKQFHVQSSISRKVKLHEYRYTVYLTFNGNKLTTIILYRNAQVQSITLFTWHSIINFQG